MKKRKKTVWQVLICVVLLFAIWGGYFYVQEYKIRRIVEVHENDFSWVYQLDSSCMKDGELVLEGFAFLRYDDAKKGAFEIILKDIESGKIVFPEMEYMSREDVNEYFLCNYNYVESGFVAKFAEEKLNLNKSYEILLRVSGRKLAYQTGAYILDGTVMYANPLEFEPLEVAGTDIEEVVVNGMLRVYRPDYGMYVYQYKGDLYWIAENTYGFVDGDTYVQYQLSTTQIDKLPIYRLQNQWNWDNIGFVFSEKELTEWNTGNYRVTRKSLPKEYAISKIWTGNHIDGWIWREDFYPYYEFDK